MKKLQTYLTEAHELEKTVKSVILGQETAIRLITIAIFARGHVLLEGDVGVGKTTLLRAFSRLIGGGYQRIEGTIDLMPNDLIYYTYLGDDGKPHVSPGPLLQSGKDLSIFFFNEINRARPQVHSLLLRVMAERTVSAFNQEYHFPNVCVFADRNQVEREETFEIPTAARDRFMMEINIKTPTDEQLREALIFETRFHDIDTLIQTLPEGLLKFYELNEVSQKIQQEVYTSPTLRQYVLKLWQALESPLSHGIKIENVDMPYLLIAGTSPRGMSMLLKTAKVNAWLNDRTTVIPEDIHTVLNAVIGHRLVLNPIYELRKKEITQQLLSAIIEVVPAI